MRYTEFPEVVRRKEGEVFKVRQQYVCTCGCMFSLPPYIQFLWHYVVFWGEVLSLTSNSQSGGPGIFLSSSCLSTCLILVNLPGAYASITLQVTEACKPFWLWPRWRHKLHEIIILNWPSSHSESIFANVRNGKEALKRAVFTEPKDLAQEPNREKSCEWGFLHSSREYGRDFHGSQRPSFLLMLGWSAVECYLLHFLDDVIQCVWML
jgi:hypothetical protein